MTPPVAEEPPVDASDWPPPVEASLWPPEELLSDPDAAPDENPPLLDEELFELPP